MAEITWRNITNSDGRGIAVQGQANGVDTIMKAFDPLEQNLKNRTALMEQNWDAKAAQNTRDMRAAIQGVQSLSDLNKMQDSGALSESGFDTKYGAQYDSSGLQQLINNQRQNLQTGLLNNITNEAMATADQERDLAAGGAKLRELIQANGGRVDFAQQASQNFMAGNQDKMSLYAKANRQDAENYLGSTPPPTKPSEVESFVANAQKAGIKDLDYIRGRLREEMDDQYKDGRYQMEKGRFALDQGRFALERGRAGREAALFAQNQQDRKNLDNFGVGMQKDIASGMDYNEAFNKNSKMLSGHQLGAAAKESRDYFEANSKLNIAQEYQYQQMAKGAEISLLNHKAELDALNAANTSAYENATGITSDVKDRVKGMEKGAVGIVKALGQSSNAEADGWLHSNFLSLTKQGSPALEALNEPLQKMRSLGIPDDEAKALLLLAYDDSVADNHTWFSGDGVNKAAMHNAVNTRIEQWQGAKALRSKMIRDQKDSEKEITNTKALLDNQLIGFRLSVLKGNRTNTYEDASKYAQEIESLTPTLPNTNFGVLERDAAEKAEARLKTIQQNMPNETMSVHNAVNVIDSPPTEQRLIQTPNGLKIQNTDGTLRQGTRKERANLLKKYQDQNQQRLEETFNKKIVFPWSR